MCEWSKTASLILGGTLHLAVNRGLTLLFTRVQKNFFIRFFFVDYDAILFNWRGGGKTKITDWSSLGTVTHCFQHSVKRTPQVNDLSIECVYTFVKKQDTRHICKKN